MIFEWTIVAAYSNQGNNKCNTNYQLYRSIAMLYPLLEPVPSRPTEIECLKFSEVL